MADTAASPAIDPLSLTFLKVYGPHRQISFTPELFKEVDKTGNELRETDTTFSGDGEVSTHDSTYTIKLTGSAPQTATLLFGAAPRAPFFCCEAYLCGLSTTGRQCQAGTGIIKDSNNYIVAVYDYSNHSLNVAINRAGIITFGPGKILSHDGVPAVIRLVATGAYIKAFVEYHDGEKEEMLSHNVLLKEGIHLNSKTYYDGSYQYGLICSTDQAAECLVTRVKAGIFGGLGIRDIFIVNDHYGDPVILHNKVYFTGSTINPCCDGDIPSLFRSVGGGVWTFDLETFAIEQVSFFFFDDGKDIFGMPCCSLNYESGNSVIVAYGSWLATGPHGEGAQTGFVETSVDLFKGVHFFRSMKFKPFTPGQVYNVDAQMYKRKDAWYLGLTYKNSADPTNYSFELVTTSDFEHFSVIHTEPLVEPFNYSRVYEAAKVCRIGGKHYFLLCGPSDVRIHDGITGRLLGSIPQSLPYTNNPANHSGIFPYNDGYGWLSFDGENYHSEHYTYGNFYFFRSNQPLGA